MKKLILATTALTALATTATAGGVERTTQSMNVLFEEGRYLEFGAVFASPDVSGVGGLVTPGLSSGDMTESYLNFSVSYKADLNDTWSYAIIYDQPYGADVSYPGAPGPGSYFAAGSTATLETHALTGVLQYNMPSNVSVYGGLRVQSLEAQVSTPFIAGYTASGERDVQLGYLVGAAYEKPEIALRVALTYHSAITHELDTTESTSATPTVTEIETPQSVNLEFQTGIAEDTLLFGSVRWVEWTAFEIAPPAFPGGSLVSYDDDRTTYTLGVGRRLNETWSVLGSVAFEDTTGSPTGNLGPTDGFWRVGVGAIYRKDNMKVTGGISYTGIGDADTRVGLAVPGGIFEDNSAVAAGLRVGWTF